MCVYHDWGANALVIQYRYIALMGVGTVRHVNRVSRKVYRRNLRYVRRAWTGYHAPRAEVRAA